MDDNERKALNAEFARRLDDPETQREIGAVGSEFIRYQLERCGACPARATVRFSGNHRLCASCAAIYDAIFGPFTSVVCMDCGADLSGGKGCAHHPTKETPK